MRPSSRSTEVSHKLSDEILFGKLKDGGQVVIGCGGRADVYVLSVEGATPALIAITSKASTAAGKRR
jgi:hypothetical protein